MTNLKDLASKNGLYTINVNNGANNAIIGFESFESARDFADAHNMSVASFAKNSSSTTYRLYDEYPRCSFDILSHYENYTKFFKGDEDEFQSVDIDEVLENDEFSSEKEKSEWLEEMQAVKTRIANLKDNEFIYLDNSGVYSEPLKVEDTFEIYNGTEYVIGVY